MKVHSLIMLMALAVTMVTGMTLLTREKRQNYDALLQNKAFVVNQINCVLRRGQCDRIGNRIKILVPEVVKSKVCLSCTEDEKGNVQKVADHVEHNYPKEWNEIREQYTEKEEEDQVEDGEEEEEEEFEKGEGGGEIAAEENEEDTTSPPSPSSASESEIEMSGKSVVVSEQTDAESETETGSGKIELMDKGLDEEEVVISKKETTQTKKHLQDEKLAIKTEATSTKATTTE